MIVPSIDLMGGRAVQLVGGKGEPVTSADPFEIAERFAVVGEIAVIDLDAKPIQNKVDAIDGGKFVTAREE